ncbi:hypothetical protein GCM10009555_041810 [Acrocarpospora macrocephala]|uniref:Molecular chaperone Hsp90 n=1 Tax=Acrocarpospora macrocephala TaxID=150177 RepID=A0A5M3WZ94_9ACTN|nr:hypothetical protein [Acrocarpospora macrocephala]GES13736.1 hypothetical protein Amac_073330 [Acrocarpospora macrocephala]
MNDFFGTTRLRETVLAAWAASPARFREDANAEEDFALGGYRDRLIVELAQNAADAALRAGVPGRLRLSLRDGVLEAVNTGAPLDAAGVEGLSTLRVSAKRDEIGAAGRFGVGFAAVVSVCDSPSVYSRSTGGVRWSREETSALVAAQPTLSTELTDRAGHVPLLRLPFPMDPAPVPDGFETLVRLPLRDKVAEQAVRQMLEETSPALPLVMPALSVIEIELDGEVRTVTGDGWHVITATGSFTPEQIAELYADRPTEERARPFWQVRWAVPVVQIPGTSGSGLPSPEESAPEGGLGGSAAGHGSAASGWLSTGGLAVDRESGSAGEPRPLPRDVPAVIHAPTPSEEALDLPALLIATFPLATDRRHVATGPLTDFLIRRAAELYVLLLRQLPRTPRLLDLVPGMLGKGELDAAIRREIVGLLPGAPLLPALSAPTDPDGEDQFRTTLNRRWATDLPVGSDAYQRMSQLVAETDGSLSASGGPPGGPRDGASAPTPASPGASGDEPLGGLSAPTPVSPGVSGDGSLGGVGAPTPVSPGVSGDGSLGGVGASSPTSPSASGDGSPRGLGGGSFVVAGREARAVAGAGEFLEKVADMVPGLLPAGWPSRHPALTTLGVRRVELADVVDMLSGDEVADREPSWWRSLYEVLPADDPEAIGAIAVPLADGRLVRGARGTLLLTEGGLDPAALAPLGLRIVHPDAAHQLLLRLGAGEATPRTVLDDPITHAAVTESAGSADPEPVAQAVLALVDAAGLSAGEAPWLAELALRGADGAVYTAGELLLEGGDLAKLIDLEAPFAAPDLVEKYGSRVLAAAGVLDGFAVVNDSDVLLDPDECDHDLDREDEWLDAILDLLPEFDVPPVAREFTAIRDLEYVADWRAALALLSRPPLRAALLPLRVLVAGEVVEVPSYTAWWLSRNPVLDGKPPTSLRLPSGDPLLFGLYADAPADVDETALTMIGVRSTLPDLLASHGGPEELLDLMADPAIELDRPQLRALWMAIAGVDPSRVRPPSAVRSILNGTIVVTDAEDGHVLISPPAEPTSGSQADEAAPGSRTGDAAGRGDATSSSRAGDSVPGPDAPAGEPVIVEAPDLLALVADRPLILAPFDLAEALSEVLDLPLVGEIVTGDVTSTGTERPVPPQVQTLLPTAPSTYIAHEELLVDGRPIPWRFFDGKVHASSVEGLARGLAWASGQWGDRLAVAALLRDPERVPLLLAEADLDS